MSALSSGAAAAILLAKAGLDSANDAVPSTVSYFAPSAARSEYHVRWERTRDGQAYIAQVSKEPLPVAEFTYAQQRSFRVELDGARSQGEGLRYEWAAVGGARIGTGEKRVHDFGEAGAFEVTLTVTDRNGVTAAERGRVRGDVRPCPGGEQPHVYADRRGEGVLDARRVLGRGR